MINRTKRHSHAATTKSNVLTYLNNFDVRTVQELKIPPVGGNSITNLS